MTFAASRGHLAVVEELLRAANETEDNANEEETSFVDYQNKHGETALLLAVPFPSLAELS